MSIAARPPRKCTIVGDGIETFGVWVVTPARYSEVVDLDVAVVAKRPGDGEPRRSEVHRLRRVGAGGDGTADLDTGELLEEVEMEPGASELAVGDAAHADRLDLAHRFGDGRVLDGALFCRGDRA